MVCVHSLSPEEVAQLLKLHRRTREADVRSRCDMILLSNEGLSAPKIAQRVRCSGRTVLRYIRRYEQEGLAGLMTRARPGRPARATTEYRAALTAAIEQRPRRLGLSFSNWTTEKLADYLAQHTGIGLMPRQVENLLRREGFTLSRPRHSVVHKQDREAVREKKAHSGPAQAGSC